MIDQFYLARIEERWEAVRDVEVAVVRDAGVVRLVARRGASETELRVLRNDDPAGDGDVTFVGFAFSDVPRLLEAVRRGVFVSSAGIAEIDARIAAASPAPWTPFIELTEGLVGVTSSV